MRQPLALALVLTISTIPACAQRGGSHGGVLHGGAPAFHGNFATATRYRPTNGPLASGRPGSGAFPFRAPGSVYGSPSNFRVSPAIARPPFYTRNRTPHPPRYPYGYGYGAGVPYIYPIWLGPSYFDYSADTDDSGDTTTPDTEAYAGIDSGQPYPPAAAEPAQPTAEPALNETDAVTLIFKDGRPPQQVRNYALTRTTLYVIGAHHRDIPVADLDLAATEKANREAGVAFQLPQPTP